MAVDERRLELLSSFDLFFEDRQVLIDNSSFVSRTWRCWGRESGDY
jgi:hypothetical protein